MAEDEQQNPTDAAAKTVPQQQVDPNGQVTNRPGTDENGQRDADEVMDENRAAELRGENRSLDQVFSNGELTVGSEKVKVTEVDAHQYQSANVFKDTDGRYYVVRGGSIEQTFSPGTETYDSFVAALDAAANPTDPNADIDPTTGQPVSAPAAAPAAPAPAADPAPATAPAAPEQPAPAAEGIPAEEATEAPADEAAEDAAKK